MGHRLAGYVHVDGQQYGPDTDVPDEVAARITNPKAWPDGKLPTIGSGADEQPPPGAVVGDQPPPMGGAGSGAPEWRAYAARRGVAVPADAERAEVIEALKKAGTPVERQ